AAWRKHSNEFRARKSGASAELETRAANAPFVVKTWKLFRVRFRQRNRSSPKYVTPTSSRPNISRTEPDFVIEGVLVSRAFNPQERSNNSRVAPYSRLLRAFLLLLVLVDRPFFSRFLDQVGFRQRSTAVCYENKVIGQNPIHYCDVIGLNCL